MMKQDIKRYFDIDFHLEKKIKKCLVLSCSDTNLLKIKTNLKDGPGLHFQDNFYVNNLTFTDVFDNLLAVTNLHFSSYPLIDETHYSGLIGEIQGNIDLNTNILDIEKFNREMKKYGLSRMDIIIA